MRTSVSSSRILQDKADHDSRRLPGAVELDALSDDDAFLSVPTKFLKSWIQSHYVDRILATLASDFPAIKRVFCHTLNALIDSRRQIVTAADRPPGDLESLDERVRSRLAGGLCIEIGALNEGLRLKILEARIAAAKLVHPLRSMSLLREDRLVRPALSGPGTKPIEDSRGEPEKDGVKKSGGGSGPDDPLIQALIQKLPLAGPWTAD
jgi:Bacterial dnaA  protein/DnaA N-terminal domain